MPLGSDTAVEANSKPADQFPTLTGEGIFRGQNLLPNQLTQTGFILVKLDSLSRHFSELCRIKKSVRKASEGGCSHLLPALATHRPCAG